jgi:hypothetical protein
MITDGSDSRGPKKKRSLRTTIALVAGVAAVGYVLKEVHWAYTAAPKPTVDYAAKMNAVVRSNWDSTSPGQPNRWPEFATLLADLKSSHERFAAGRGPQPEGWSKDETWPTDYGAVRAPKPGDSRDRITARAAARDGLKVFAAEGLLQRLDGVVEYTRAFREIPEGDPAKSEGLMGVLLPELADARHAARVNSARMEFALEEGRTDEYLRAFKSLLVTGDILSRQATLIDRLVGIAIHAMATSRLREHARDGRLDVPTMETVLALLETTERSIPPTTLQLKAERYFSLDAVQRCYEEGSGGRFVPTAYDAFMRPSLESMGTQPSTTPASGLKNLTAVVMPRRGVAEARFNELWDRTIEWADLSRAARAGSAINPDQTIAELTTNDRGMPLVVALMPAVGRYVETVDQIGVDRAGTRVLVAVELFRVRHGRLPAALTELVPGEFSDLPLDLYAADGQFRYFALPDIDPTATNTDPAANPKPTAANHPLPYVLYSVGRDGSDDGATSDFYGPERGVLNSPATRKGTDWVITRPTK